ncbi:membrane hypothetical protein [Candidatus Zixiibacteriota bacterium]|nr:membrane hypothetical protein [candidate division Zixibacteria bacterium]
MKKIDINLLIFIALIVIYILGQFLIGTFSPTDRHFHFDTPADVDFLYYGAIGTQLLNNFPPQDPAFSGTNLTQPFLQFYPVALLAKIINPYNGIRVLGIIYLILAGLLLKRYFPERYGLPLLILFAGSTFAPGLNSAGIDLIARGFAHAPFYILFLIALYERQIIGRAVALFLAALVNGYMMMMILPFLLILFLIQKKREWLYLLMAGAAGSALAFLYIWLAAPAQPAAGMILRSIYFDPREIIKHLIPFAILAYVYRSREMIILLAVAAVFGTFVHHNPFFPIFLIYFCGAMMIAANEAKVRNGELLGVLVVGLLFIGFLLAAYQKYNPFRGDYYPRSDSRVRPALNWIAKNTPEGASFLALTADEKDLALVMEERPVYIGYIGHLAHLGINWKERYDKTILAFQSGQIPPEADYVFYGPVERKYFPGASFAGATIYQDRDVSIIKSSR